TRGCSGLAQKYSQFAIAWAQATWAYCCARKSIAKKAARIALWRRSRWCYIEGQIKSQCTCTVLRSRAVIPTDSGLTDRWDRNRTCALRLWSLLPFVQQRSGTYTKGLKSAHFDTPKYVDVHQRSPALGSTLGSNLGNRAVSIHTGI